MTLDNANGVARLEIDDGAFISIDDVLEQDNGYNTEQESEFDSSELNEDTVVKLDWSV